MSIQRGEVYLVELGPTRGREIDNKRRPVVVLSINAINRNGWVITVIPGTTKNPAKRVYQNEAVVQPTPDNGLSHPTAFLGDQVKALDASRFDASAIGVLSNEDMVRIEATIKLCLGLI